MTITYVYNDANGHYLGTITRNIDANGKKTFRASAGFPSPRPLYGLARLAQRPAAAVLVCEGEKAADAAGKIFPDYVCVTSPFGALSAAKADWTPLHGRTVVIWPDHDTAGAKYASDVAGLVPNAKVVPVPASWPDGWDLADDLPGNITQETLASLLLLAEAPKVKKKKPSKDDLRRTAEEAKAERDGIIAKIRALLAKTTENGCTEAEAASAASKAKELARHLMDEHGMSEEDLAAMADVEEDDTKEQLRASAAAIIAGKDVLKLFEADWAKVVAGEVRNAKLLYLVATSRLFQKSMHAAIKGPSSAGKSEIRKRVLSFFPPESIISFTLLSEKSLLYFEDDFPHMIISMGEACGTEEAELQDYLLRELMSEDVLRYPVVQKVAGNLVTQTIVKNGPVCFLVTTTKNKLNAENETRMLSLEVDDSAEQTSAVLDKVADTVGLNIKADGASLLRWRDFQRWLALGNLNVVVPYARSLSALIAPRSVRLRRDLSQILVAIKSHALLHREHRYVDETGAIVATLDDYAAVAALMADIVAETAETKIKATVYATVAAVRKLQVFVGSEGVTAQAVGKELKLDKSSARRRLVSAVDAGLIRNLETRKFQPGLYRTTDIDQDTQELLPSPEELTDRWCKDYEEAA